MADLIRDIWSSLRALPLWVQIWVFVILVPVNCAAILFLGAPYGVAVAMLAIGGMFPNAILIVVERGFSKAMSLSHLLLWGPLIALLVWILVADAALSEGFRRFIWLLLFVDAISLVFDVPESLKWQRGDRKVAGR